MRSDDRAAALVFVILVVSLALIILFAYANKGHPEKGTRTQVVAVCDSRGNTVYTTSTGGIYVLEGCR